MHTAVLRKVVHKCESTHKMLKGIMGSFGLPLVN